MLTRLRLTRTNLLYTCILLFLQPCGPCGNWYAIDVGSTGDLKRANFLEIVTENAKVSARNYTQVDVLTGETTKVKGDRRIAVAGKKKNELGHGILGGPWGSGSFSVGATKAIDGLDFLESDVSYSFISAGYPGGSRELRVYYSLQVPLGFDEDGPPVLVPGFIARAYDHASGSDPIGEAFLPGASQVDARLEQDDTDFYWRVREHVPYVEAADAGEFAEVATIPSVPLAGPNAFQVFMGAVGLPAKAEFYFDKFWFLGDDLGGVDPERTLTAELRSVELCLCDVDELLQGEVDAGDISEAAGRVGNILFGGIDDPGLANIFNEIDTLSKEEKDQQSEEDGFSADSVDDKGARRQSQGAYKRLHKIYKLLDGMDQSGNIQSGKINAARKGIEAVKGKTKVAQANLQGFRVRSSKQLAKIFYPIPVEDLPSFLFAASDED